MAADTLIAQELFKSRTVEEIREIKGQVFAAYLQRVTVNIQVNSLSFEGGTSSGITLTSPEEQRAFIETCNAAIALHEGTTGVPASAYGHTVNFSFRAVGA